MSSCSFWLLFWDSFHDSFGPKVSDNQWYTGYSDKGSNREEHLVKDVRYTHCRGCLVSRRAQVDFKVEQDLLYIYTTVVTK